LNIGIIGAGMIGATTARLFTRAGHDVAISNTRGPDSLAGLVAELGTHAQARSAAEAASFGDVVLLAIPFGTYGTLPAEQLRGKIVVDATNYYPNRDGQLNLDNGTSSELIARHLPSTRLIKAFNTMYFQTLASGGRPDLPADERLALLVAGDDAEAKATVAHLIDEIGFTAVDTGSLREGGRRQQPGAPLYNQPTTAAAARIALETAQ
jgi:8-hydroxy-5-deazaflavin:NADPH oxidoreductase